MERKEIGRAIATLRVEPRSHQPAQISDSDVQALFDEYVRLHLAKYFGKPVFRSIAEAKTTLRDVLKKVSGGRAQVMRMLTLYFNDDRKYYRDRCHSLEPFLKDVQTLAAQSNAQAKQSAPQRNQRIRTDTTCPRCGRHFVLECDVHMIDKLVLLTLCNPCTNNIGSNE